MWRNFNWDPIANPNFQLRYFMAYYLNAISKWVGKHVFSIHRTFNRANVLRLHNWKECFEQFTDDRQRMLHIIIIFFPGWKNRRKRKVTPWNEIEFIRSCDPQFKACMIAGRTNWFIFWFPPATNRRLIWETYWAERNWEIGPVHDIIIRRLKAEGHKLNLNWKKNH